MLPSKDHRNVRIEIKSCEPTLPSIDGDTEYDYTVIYLSHTV